MERGVFNSTVQFVLHLPGHVSRVLSRTEQKNSTCLFLPNGGITEVTLLPLRGQIL
jgi:hypothetical protein